MGRRIVLTVALLLSTCAGVLSPAASAIAQRGDTGLQGNTYVDPVYGFAVEWDQDTFDAEEMLLDDDTPYGVYLTSDDITASIAAGGYADLQECLDDRIDRLEAIDGVSGLRESRRVDPLEFDREVLGGVYQYSYEDPDSGDSATYATYFGCEPLSMDGEEQDGVVLTHDFGTTLANYDDLSAEWIPVINGIVFAGESDANTDQSNSNDGDQSENRDETDASATGGISGNQYIDPIFLFSVSWDEDAYDAEELSGDEEVPYGVSLTSDTVLASVFSGLYGTQRACINGEADSFESLDGVTDFAEADDLDLPESDTDGRVALYRYTYENPDTGITTDLVQYIECRDIIVGGDPLDDVFLVIEFGVPEQAWDDTIPDVEDIISSIEFDVEPGSDDASTPDNQDATNSDASDEPGVNGNHYLDPTEGWAVTWDDTFLTGENWTPGDSEDIQGVQLASDGGNFVTVFTFEADTLRSCVSDQVDVLAGSSFTDFEKLSDEKLPETSDESWAALYQGVFTNDKGVTSDIYLYADCRPLIVDGDEVDGKFLVFAGFATPERWVSVIDPWSEVLLSVEFDAAASTSVNKPDKERTPATDASEPGIAGDTYTSSIGYQISWDDSVYDSSLLDDSNPDRGLNLSSSGSFMTFQVAGDPSARDCVDAEAGTVEGLSGMSRLSASREDGPEAAESSESDLYGGVLTFDNGSESDVVVYIECRPLGEVEDSPLFLVIRMVGLADSYDNELPLWQDIIDSIQFFDPAGE